jgi:hypothetical protein
MARSAHSKALLAGSVTVTRAILASMALDEAERRRDGAQWTAFAVAGGIVECGRLLAGRGGAGRRSRGRRGPGGAAG